MATGPAPRKHALIVDDSRLAREFLRHLLEEYDLRVETTASAEAALEYLVDHRPDVIFMDHQMPGMDGLQAVKAIKENPATATIPVMMYTSQSGELYVGQARALGAVGVLPKQIKPVEVAEVLRSLHLLPGDAPAPAVRVAEAGDLPGPESVLAPADWSDLHRWLQRMLADQNRTLRQDLEATVTRLLATQPPAAPPRPAFWPSGLLTLVLAAVAATFFWLHLDAQARWQAAAARNVELSAALDARRAEQAAAARGEPRVVPVAATAVPDRVLPLAELERAANVGPALGPDEIPFGDRRRDQLGQLVGRLGALGFRGRIVLESHAGDFCVVRTRDSALELAPDNLPAERCDRVGLTPDEARALSGRQSVRFANFLAELEAGGGPIRVELAPLGNLRPRVPYPVPEPTTTAGEWNAIARANHRVDVRLVADPPAAAGG